MPRKSDKPRPLLTVLYDSGRRSWRTRIALYKLEARRAALDLQWRDLAEEPGAADEFGIAPDLHRTLYAIDGDGAVFEGAAALALLWSALPSHRRLGHLLASPAASAIAEACGRIGRLMERRRPAPSRG